MARSRAGRGAAEAARHASEKRGLREHEAGAMDQQHLRDQRGADPDKRAGVKGVLVTQGRSIEGRGASAPTTAAS